MNMLNDAGMGLLLNTVAYAIGGGAKPTLSFTRNGDRIVVTYAGGTLESSDSVSGPWSGENAASPASFPTTAARKFYRVRG